MLVAPAVALALAPSAGAAACSAGSTQAGHGFDNGEWVVRKQAASIPEAPFETRVDGTSIGRSRLLTFASRVPGSARFPQVLVVAASGYLRMKPGADPPQPLPFGQSLVLGPAVFGSSRSVPGPTLFFNPQLQRVAIDTCDLRGDGTGRLHVRLTAQDRNLAASSTKLNQVMNLRWDLVLYEPKATRTRLDVAERYRFTERVTPDSASTQRRESFRLVQVSSMFIDAARHDVDEFRFRSPTGLYEVPLDPSQAGTLLPVPPTRLDPSRPLLDSLHTDDAGQPNGNTPSYRIRVTDNTGPVARRLFPRAFFTSTQDLNDDNYGLWIHARPPGVIAKDSVGTIGYSVVATEDPLPAP